MLKGLKGLRTRAVWLAIGLILGGSALATAAVSTGEEESPTPKPSKTAKVKQAEPKPKKSAEADDVEASSHERKRNHGYFVSTAAHCEDVSDPEHDLTFTAPDDCETDGAAKGEYVSSVAKSQAGKKPKPNDE